MLYRGRDKKEFYLASLLYDSIEYQHTESVTSLLCERGADPNLVLSKKGISPFHLAVGCDSYDFALEVISLILRHGGNPNVRSDDGLTPVHITAAWGRTELLELLLRNGGDPTVRDVNGKSSLHYALEEGHIDCLNLLKTYLPSKNDLINDDDDSNACLLTLDRIMVQAGATVGEYVFAKEETGTHSITSSHNNLQSLPQTKTTDYVLNWVSQQSQKEPYDNSPGSPGESLGTTTSFDFSDESLVESDGNNEVKRYDPKYITFRKIYRKTRSKSTSPKLHKSGTTHSKEPSVIDETCYTDAKDLTGVIEYSKESGVVTIPNSLENSAAFLDETSGKKNGSKEEKSSDYFTCSRNSINSLERNIFEITEDLSCLEVCETDNREEGKPVEDASVESECTFVSVSEVYKYFDKKENVVLYEKRFVTRKFSGECSVSPRSSNASSLSSLPPTFDYDTDTLRQELTQLGFSPGPITRSTKRIYLKKLHHLREHPTQARSEVQLKKRVYSVELEKCLRNFEWCNDLTFRNLEDQLRKQFSSPNPSVKWREGNIKSSFTYLLLDPRVTNNLPHRCDTLTLLQAWQTFLSAIFYVGKGKRSRPYQHLYDAVDFWKKGEPANGNKKLQKILDIWENGSGVICLHVFLNIIPVEAYTREAAMISAITLENLTNVKGGEFYGVAATWPQKHKKMLGVYLLQKAMMIFLHEGERQLCPRDIY